MTIPKKAKAVFKGKRFVLYEWQQKMFDGRFSVFEVIKKSDSVVIIPTIKNKVVVSHMRHPNGSYYYALFGGMIEHHEESLATAKRELLEETGFISDEWKLIKKYNTTGDVKHKMYLYVAKDCIINRKQPFNAGEKIKIVFLSFDQLMILVQQDNFLSDEITIDLLRMQFDKKRLNDFKQEIFS